MFTLYEFSTKDGKSLFTSFSPREISKFNCFDGYDGFGQNIVILTKDVNFQTFSLIN